VLCAPAPFGVDRPQRDVRKHYDRRRSGAAFHVGGEPGELIGAEIAEAAGFQIDDIHEPDKVHAAGVEAVPAGALRAASVALVIELALLIEEIVFARHVMYVEPALRDDAVG